MFSRETPRNLFKQKSGPSRKISDRSRVFIESSHEPINSSHPLFSLIKFEDQIEESVIVVSITKLVIFLLIPNSVSFSEIKMSIVPGLFGDRRSNIFDPFSWDPFKDFTFPASLSSDASRETSAMVNTRVDWKETPEAHVFKADLPGIKKEEVKVEVEDGRILLISGERNVEKEDKNDTWHRVERSGGKFTRRFRLPENAKMDEVKASMENGVLTVTVPKEDVKKPDVKSIEISG